MATDQPIAAHNSASTASENSIRFQADWARTEAGIEED
ncbi:Unknown protein sequence [Pseudomonas syringae pv. maculicola]|nr:Unknown protein sequence [Pseudomonas syringae pv. maculicola]